MPPGKAVKKKLLFGVMTLVIALVVVAICGEVLARFRGIEPWDPHPIGIVVEPGGRYFQKHPTLGYSQLPGSFIVSMPQTGLVNRVTHLDDTLRITRPLESYADDLRGREGIWLFGGSFTYGWGLNDEETFAWLLQEAFPDREVVNFGVPGYGTLHGLIQLREALRTREAPATAIIVYATFHDMRNTFLRKHRKTLVQGNRLGPLALPFARLDRDGRLHIEMADVVYREFPLMRVSAFAHLLAEFYDDSIEDRFIGSEEVTRAVFLEFQRICEENGIELLVAAVDDWSGTAMPGFLAENGIPTVEIWVDMSDPRYLNLRDVFRHPNGLANRTYAERIESFLRDDPGRFLKEGG